MIKMDGKEISKIRSSKNNAIYGLINGLVQIILSFFITREIIHIYGDIANGFLGTVVNICGYFVILDAGLSSVASKYFYQAFKTSDNNMLAGVFYSVKKLFNIIALIVLAGSILTGITIALSGGELSTIWAPWKIVVIAILIMSRTVINYLFFMPNKVLLDSSLLAYKVINGPNH